MKGIDHSQDFAFNGWASDMHKTLLSSLVGDASGLFRGVLDLWAVGVSSWDLCVLLNPRTLVGWLIGPQTSVGYTQGKTKNPTYREVCSGQTGHVEAVQVDFNPAETSYKTLLDVFWKKHDPTQKNRQALYSLPSSLHSPCFSFLPTLGMQSHLCTFILSKLDSLAPLVHAQNIWQKDRRKKKRQKDTQSHGSSANLKYHNLCTWKVLLNKVSL